jgi:hypothetical protein
MPAESLDHKKAGPASVPSPDHDGPPPGTTGKQRKSSADRNAEKKTDAKIREYRRRQNRAARIIEKTFGPFHASNPRRWEERVYLMLIGTVYEMLVADAGNITHEELSTIARILAEGRKIPVNAGKSRAAAREKPAKGANRREKSSDPARSGAQAAEAGDVPEAQPRKTPPGQGAAPGDSTAAVGKKGRARLREFVAELYGTDAEREKS